MSCRYRRGGGKPRFADIIIIIIIIIITGGIGTINSNDRIATTMCSLGTWFVSGIYV
jgi:hypothetical protein